MLVNRIHKPYICRICGNATGIKICKCQRAFYCSKSCQKIDWKSHKSDCYKLVEHPSTSRNLNFADNHLVESNQSSNGQEVLQHQQFSDTQIQANDIRERQQYDPPLHRENAATNTSMLPTTVDDFEENLLNSLMYSVDESTEQEILRNLNIRADELLSVCNLNCENSSSLDDQQPFAGTELFDEQLFEQIQQSESFDYQPSAQQLLQDTRNDLEKELLMFREINLHESKVNLVGDERTSADIMQLSQTNPKYINHAKLDDHLLYK